MKKVDHWNAYYVASRIREIVDYKNKPEDPWFTRDAIGLLSQLIKKSDKTVEFGSGRSTVWFAKRVAHLTSVEHSPEWHGMISEKLNHQGLSNVDFLLKSFNNTEDEMLNNYVKVADDFGDESIDFVLVDCMLRDIRA